MRRFLILSAVVFTIFTFTTSLFAGVPQMINYQGRLTDDQGDPVNATVSMIFTIYSQANDGEIWWTETHTTVQVTDGLFNVILGGATEPIDDSVFSEPDRYLGIAVNGDPEIQPRTRLLSVGYSHRVSTVDGAAGGVVSGNVTIGSNNINTTSSGLVAGSDNIADAEGACVLGGGSNRARGDYSVVAGGGGDTPSDSNAALGINSTICGGERNTASGMYSSVGGGSGNVVTSLGASISGGVWNYAYGDYSTVAGGGDSQADGEYSAVVGGSSQWAQGAYSFAGGGYQNIVRGDYGVIAGGDRNAADSSYTFIGSGMFNRAEGNFAVVNGGQFNRARGSHSVVAGGGGPDWEDSNSAIGEYSVVGGGRRNTADADGCVVNGGYGNYAGDEGLCTVAGGSQNEATGGQASVGGGSYNTASGPLSTVPGGYGNLASGGFSFATGYDCTASGDATIALGFSATASHDGSFIWNNATGSSAGSEDENQFKVVANGGVKLEVNNSTTFQFKYITSPFSVLYCSNGAYLTTTGSWHDASKSGSMVKLSVSDRKSLLDRVASLPVGRWIHSEEGAEITSFGPSAQDFHDAFGIGYGDGLAASDQAGIALAAIQELHKKNKELEAEVAELRALVEKLIDNQ